MNFDRLMLIIMSWLMAKTTRAVAMLTTTFLLIPMVLSFIAIVIAIRPTLISRMMMPLT